MTAADKHDAMLQVILAVAEAIRDLGEVPSGHLYARLMGHMTIGTYEGIIGALQGSGLVTEENHLLTWAGPKKAVQS
jgi:hypothetical protein